MTTVNKDFSEKINEICIVLRDYAANGTLKSLYDESETICRFINENTTLNKLKYNVKFMIVYNYYLTMQYEKAIQVYNEFHLDYTKQSFSFIYVLALCYHHSRDFVKASELAKFLLFQRESELSTKENHVAEQVRRIAYG